MVQAHEEREEGEPIEGVGRYLSPVSYGKSVVFADLSASFESLRQTCLWAPLCVALLPLRIIYVW